MLSTVKDDRSETGELLTGRQRGTFERENRPRWPVFSFLGRRARSGCGELGDLALHVGRLHHVLVHTELLRLEAERQPDHLREVEDR